MNLNAVTRSPATDCRVFKRVTCMHQHMYIIHSVMWTDMRCLTF